MANASTYRATINLGELRQGRRGQNRIRNGQKHNMRAQKGGSQVYKELPRTFLPQKSHWATVIALALGLEGGSKRAACVCAGVGGKRGGGERWRLWVSPTNQAPPTHMLPENKRRNRSSGGGGAGSNTEDPPVP